MTLSLNQKIAISFARNVSVPKSIGFTDLTIKAQTRAIVEIQKRIAIRSENLRLREREVREVLSMYYPRYYQEISNDEKTALWLEAMEVAKAREPFIAHPEKERYFADERGMPVSYEYNMVIFHFVGFQYDGIPIYKSVIQIQDLC